MSPLTPKDCLAVLRAAKNYFLAVIGKVSPRDSPLEMTECCLVLFYLEAIVILKHLQRPGVVEHMTVKEWMKRTRQESGYTVIKHPTSVQQVSTFALSLEEDMWFDTYFSHVRPQLLICKRSRKTQDDMGGDERFFVSTAGRPISGASNDIRRLHQKYQLNPMNSQTARQAFEMASKQMTDSERSLVADSLSHCTTTPDDVVLASKLLGKLAGDSSDSSADEGPNRGPHGAAWGAPSGSYAKMDAQAAYDQLLQTHPVTLDGDVPDRTALSQTSGQFKRQLYERWLKAQLKLRVQHVL
ncbi:uncharacterized protein [Paramormyrops kingsleyae]|uniref:uncharacterized protein n=1 Tax=Paramormyrops kingsleyae TaxID=1676925 RepID=UPI003B96DEE4